MNSFFKVIRISLIIFCAATYQQSNAIQSSSSKAAVQKLSSCAVERSDTRELLHKIETSAEVSGQTNGSCSNEASKPNLITGNMRDIVKAGVKGKNDAQTPSADLIYDFAHDIWLQSMQNLVMTRLDAELRYNLGPEKKKPEPSVERIFDDFCSREGDGKGAENECRLTSKINVEEKYKLFAKGLQYIKDFKAAKVVALTPDDARVELNQRIDKIRKAKEVVQAIEDEIPNSTGPANGQGVAVSDATSRTLAPDLIKYSSLYKKKTNWKKRLTKAKENFASVQAEQSSSGSGLLLYSKALEKYRSGASIPGDYPVIGAVQELKKGTLLAAGQLNIDVGWATGLEPDTKKNASVSWLDKMIVTNPVAVGQLLAKEPKYVANICYFLQRIEDSAAINERLTASLQTVMFASMIVGGVAVTPELFALRLGEGVTEKLAAIRALNSALASSTFYGSVGEHVVQNMTFPSKIEAARRSILQGSGATGADLEANKHKSTENDEAIAMDVFYLATPAVLGSLSKIGKGMRPAIKVLEPGPITEEAQNIAKQLSRNKQYSAAYHVFSLACGMLDQRCGTVMLAFEHLPGSPSERLAAQKNILSSKENMAEFIKKTSESESLADKTKNSSERKSGPTPRTKLIRKLAEAQRSTLSTVREKLTLDGLDDQSIEQNIKAAGSALPRILDLGPTKAQQIVKDLGKLNSIEMKVFQEEVKKNGFDWCLK